MNTERLIEWKKCSLSFRAVYVLLYCYTLVKGVVELSPSPVAPVCEEEGQLDLTCNTTSGSSLDHSWEFTVFPENVTHTTRPVSSIGESGIPPPLTVRTSTITFSRLSGPNILSLISRVTVNPVSSFLNGTMVKCIDIDADSVATTTIQIVDSQQFELSVRSDSEDFSTDGVRVTLQWTLLNSRIYYQQLLRDVSVSAYPQPKSVIFAGNMRAQLVLSYNTQYNVSITQHSTCQQLIRTTFLELIFYKCSDPMELTSAIAVGYVDPAQEGQTIQIVCPHGQILNGSNSSTCMENGEWEPDPGEVECTGPTVATNVTSQTTDCMLQGTCSGPSTIGNSQDQGTLGIALGVIFGIVLAVTIAIVVVILIFILNKKGILKCSNNARHSNYRYPVDIELNTQYDSKNDGTLVYADIGRHPVPGKSIPLLPDDNRVEYALLDHNVQSQESSAAIKKSGNCPSVNLDNLLIQLRPQVGPKWYQFGEAAGIPKDALNKIAEQCPPDQCIVEVLDYWLRNSVNSPTWKIVADVLKAMNLKELGCDIEKIYVTGTLPVVVDMNHVPKLDTQEEEPPPPPLPARSANLYIDAPHTSQAGSQNQNPRVVVSSPLNNEVSAPALPPKPPRMKSTDISAVQPV